MRAKVPVGSASATVRTATAITGLTSSITARAMTGSNIAQPATALNRANGGAGGVTGGTLTGSSSGIARNRGGSSRLQIATFGTQQSIRPGVQTPSVGNIGNPRPVAVQTSGSMKTLVKLRPENHNNNEGAGLKRSEKGPELRITKSEQKPEAPIESMSPANIGTIKRSLISMKIEIPVPSMDSDGGSISKESSLSARHPSESDMKALKREKKSLTYLLKVRAEIQKELDQRVSNCRNLKRRVDELTIEHQKLVPRLDRIRVEHQSTLEDLK
jgi:hypothetical protein